MTERIYNFSAGPAVLPVPVLEEAQRDMIALPGVGMSVMEISHRSKTFDEIIGGAEQGLRELMGIPENYKVLFLQGGASLQFSMIPINLLPEGQTADYIITGSWGKKPSKRSESAQSTSPRTPKTAATPHARQHELKSRGCGLRPPHFERDDEGVELGKHLPDGDVAAISDASSNILSGATNRRSR